MNKTTIRCMTTAPVFMAGADQNKPELRAASIKGVMRFVWRAAQRAGDIQKLRELEGSLFGNAFGGKNTKASDMRIRIENADIATGSEIMVPHRRLYNGRMFPAQAIKVDSEFDIVISSFVDKKQHTDYVRLFALTCLLYGFGRRSRKGFGTVVIRSIDGVGKEIDHSIDGAVDSLNAISRFGAKYSFADNTHTKIAVTGGGGGKYPYIEGIRIMGAENKPETKFFVEQIGMAVHNFSSSKTFLGDLRNRFASSVLLSTIPWETPDFCCIATQLYCTKAFDPAERDRFYDELDGRV